MRRSVRIDEYLKIGFNPNGGAWAEAPAGEKPDTFVSRALTKAGATSSTEIAALCKLWAKKWEAQNGRPS
jgi:hypothetical protein